MPDQSTLSGSDQQWQSLFSSARAGSHRMSSSLKFKPFNGKNISAFLTRYNLKARDNQATDDKKISYLQGHVNEETWPKVRNLIQTRDWSVIESELKAYLKTLDSDENVAPEEKLLRLNSQHPSKNSNIYDWMIKHRSACQ